MGSWGAEMVLRGPLWGLGGGQKVVREPHFGAPGSLQMKKFRREKCGSESWKENVEDISEEKSINAIRKSGSEGRQGRQIRKRNSEELRAGLWAKKASGGWRETESRRWRAPLPGQGFPRNLKPHVSDSAGRVAPLGQGAGEEGGT